MTIPSDATLTLQIQESPGSSIFRDIESDIENNQVIFTIPDVPVGSYQVRLRDQHQNYSEAYDIQLETVPSVVLTTLYFIER